MFFHAIAIVRAISDGGRGREHHGPAAGKYNFAGFPGRKSPVSLQCRVQNDQVIPLSRANNLSDFVPFLIDPGCRNRLRLMRDGHFLDLRAGTELPILTPRVMAAVLAAFPQGSNIFQPGDHLRRIWTGSWDEQRQFISNVHDVDVAAEQGCDDQCGAKARLVAVIAFDRDQNRLEHRKSLPCQGPARATAIRYLRIRCRRSRRYPLRRLDLDFLLGFLRFGLLGHRHGEDAFLESCLDFVLVDPFGHREIALK